jgi:Tfp pilus assembly protein PilV
MFNKKLNNAGSSVIEVLVAVGIFVIISVTALSAIIGATNIGRLTKEQTQAAQFAQQGYEASVSIKNNDWTNLVNGTHGLSSAGSQWSFSGGSDVDSSGKFTRTILIESVNRDANNVIVNSGGTVDENTKKITINVAWNPSPTRSNDVTYVSYLTNWQLTSFEGSSGGGPTPTPPAPTPTTAPTSCAQICTNNSYSTGTCRKNAANCNKNGETRVTDGDIFCTGGSKADTCCCAP